MLSRTGCILLSILALWASRESLRAQDSAAARVLGRVLVLENERCFEGEIEALDDQYCVRQGTSEVWISGKRVLRVCPDWDSAYRFMQQRANLEDPDERLRLARWCQRHNLLREALNEAKAALDLRPLHSETRHLISVLNGTIAVRKSVSTVPAPANEPIDDAPTPDLTPETAVQFAVKIQPILINACIRCHSNGKGGEFQLYRASDGGQKRALQRNLKSVLGQVRFDDARLSPLLIKSISPHGATAAAPLPGKKAVPYQSLETWVRFVVDTHPHLLEEANARKPTEAPRASIEFATTPPAATRPASTVPSAPSPGSAAASGTTKSLTAPVLATTPTDPPAAPTDGAPKPTVARDLEVDPALPGAADPLAPSSPTPMAEPGDVYSAADFNRILHPRR